jgi:hypothetical protein
VSDPQRSDAAAVDSARPITENPFLVLGMSPDATRIELEREAQKLLGMLELGFAEAQFYATPIGPRPRTAEAVRAAVATLRDPHQRLVAELWARNAPPPRPADEPDRERAPITGIRRALGWRP